MLRENYIFLMESWFYQKLEGRKVRWNEWWRQLQLGRQLTIKNEWRNRQRDRQTDRQTDRQRRGWASNKYSLGHHPPILSVQPTYLITEKNTHGVCTRHAMHIITCEFLLCFYTYTDGRWVPNLPSSAPPFLTHSLYRPHTPSPAGAYSPSPLFFITKLAYMFFGTVGALPRTVRHEHEYQKAREDQCWQDHTLSTFPLMPLIPTLYSYLFLPSFLPFSFFVSFFLCYDIFLCAHPHSKLLDCTVGDGEKEKKSSTVHVYLKHIETK